MSKTPSSPDASARQAGAVQGMLAMLAACLPLVAAMALPAAMPKLEAHFGRTPGAAVLVPMLAAAPAACIALLAPIAGLLADRFGRRRMVLGALVVFTASASLPLMVDNLWLILASRLTLGVANAALLTIGTTLIGDYYDGAARRRWLAVNGVMGSLLISLAMLAGGVLAEWSWRGPFLLGLLGVPALLLCFAYLFEPTHHADLSLDLAQGGEPFPWRSLGVLAGLTVVVSILFYAEALQIGLVLDQAGLKSSGLIAAVGALASTGYPLGSVVFSRLAGRWPARAVSCLGWSLFGLGLIGVGAFGDYRAIGVGGFVQQLGGGVLLTGLIHDCYERFPFRYRARSMGVWAAFFFAGQFGSPLIMASAGAALGGLRPAIAALGFVPLMIAALSAAVGWAVRLRPAVRPA